MQYVFPQLLVGAALLFGNLLLVFRQFGRVQPLFLIEITVALRIERGAGELVKGVVSGRVLGQLLLFVVRLRIKSFGPAGCIRNQVAESRIASSLFIDRLQSLVEQFFRRNNRLGIPGAVLIDLLSGFAILAHSCDLPFAERSQLDLQLRQMPAGPLLRRFFGRHQQF